MCSFILGQGLEPYRGILEEGDGGEVVPLATTIDESQVRADESHIMVLRQPGDIDGVDVGLELIH